MLVSTERERERDRQTDTHTHTHTHTEREREREREIKPDDSTAWVIIAINAESFNSEKLTFILMLRGNLGIGTLIWFTQDRNSGFWTISCQNLVQEKSSGWCEVWVDVQVCDVSISLGCWECGYVAHQQIRQSSGCGCKQRKSLCGEEILAMCKRPLPWGKTSWTHMQTSKKNTDVKQRQ